MIMDFIYTYKSDYYIYSGKLSLYTPAMKFTSYSHVFPGHTRKVKNSVLLFLFASGLMPCCLLRGSSL
jgi:hypothetical protein